MPRIIALAILAIAPVAMVFPLATLAQGGRSNEDMQNEVSCSGVVIGKATC
jgi:hypothetical protein